MGLRRAAVTIAVVAMCATATACVGTGGVTRAGVAAPSAVLRLGVAEAPGAMPDQIAEIVTRSVQESAGVEFELWRQPDADSRWNQELAQRLIDGELDVAVLAAPAWDALGVADFSALFLPFAVASDELLDRIAQSDIATDMLKGLEPLGVTGLGLVPAGFRHLFSPSDEIVDPLESPGAAVRVAYSTTVWGYYEAIGAKPIDPNGDRSDDMAATGGIDAFDSLFTIADGFLASPAAAGDVRVHAHAFTIVASSAALERLTPEQRDALRAGARAAVDWSVQTRPTDAEAAEALCRRAPGARVFLAGAEAVDALRQASRPLAVSVLEDPVVAGFADRIAALDAQLGHPVSPAASCEGGALAGPGEAPPNVPAEFPDGEYRREVTRESLIAAGVDVSTATVHEGLWVLVFEDGVLVDPNCVGSRYEVVADRLVVTLGTGANCGTAAQSVFFSAGWSLDGDELTFTAVESGHGSDLLIREAIGGGPWRKVR